jgi:hypothetical protein
MQTAATVTREGATYVLAPVVASDTVRTFCAILYNVPARQGFMSAILFLLPQGVCRISKTRQNYDVGDISVGYREESKEKREKTDHLVHGRCGRDSSPFFQRMADKGWPILDPFS